MKHVAFVGGMVFDSYKEEFVKANIICRDGYIVEVSSSYLPSGYEQINVSGKYIIPGLVDVHTHGIKGGDFNEADENMIGKMRRAYAKNGTTSVMATLASYPLTRIYNSIYAINQHRIDESYDKANIIGIHMEGRYLNPEMKGAHALELLALPNLNELQSLCYIMVPSPMHFSIAPELEGGKEFIMKARELGATVGIAHTKATYEECEEAVSLGACSFTHTFNAMTPIHHRMPGAAICSLTNDTVYTELICDGEHVHPAMVRLAYKTKPHDKLVLITDSMQATDHVDGYYGVAGSGVIVKNGRATKDDGTLAGSTLTMFKALKNTMKFCGIGLNKALRFATLNPAKMVGADFVGSIEKNYRADFILLDNIENPEIQDVYIGGNKINRGE